MAVNREDVKQIKKEISRLEDLALNMYEDKYSKKARDNHRRLEMLRRQLKRLEDK